ncbi:DUF3592 domain-containing protein [Micromonospora sp. NPDC004704]
MAFFGERRRPPVPLFVGLGIVVIVGFAIATVQVWRNDNALRDHGERTTARVVEVDAGRANRTEVEFRTSDGRQVRALIGQGDEAPGPPPALGDEVPIVYDPQDPQADVNDARAGENHDTAYLLLGVTLFGGIGVPLATWALVRANRRDRVG